MMAAMASPAGQRISRRSLMAWPLALRAGGAPGASQELPSASELTGRILELRRGVTARARGRLVHTDTGKQQKVFQISVLRKCLGRNTNLLWSVVDPPQARLRILIEASPQGRATVWRVSQAKAGAVVLSPKSWSERILGTHITFEDLVEDFLSWPKQVVTGVEVEGEKPCYVLRSEPDEQHPSAYAAVQSWIDRATLVPLRILKTLRGSGARKQVICRGVRRSGGHWVASNIEFRVLGLPGSTRIVFTQGSGNARVSDSEVDPKLAFGAGAENR
jgi:hypothetical protein